MTEHIAISNAILCDFCRQTCQPDYKMRFLFDDECEYFELDLPWDDWREILSHSRKKAGRRTGI